MPAEETPMSDEFLFEGSWKRPEQTQSSFPSSVPDFSVIIIRSSVTLLLCLFGSQVKEKEKARREYKLAIEQGHGAYLMDQDAPVCRPSSLNSVFNSD